MLKRPLLSYLSIWDMAPGQFRAHIFNLRSKHLEFKSAKKALHKERTKANAVFGKPRSPVDGVTYRVNNKGTPIITMKRKPKYITKSELDALAIYYKLPLQTLWNIVVQKGIEVRS